MNSKIKYTYSYIYIVYIYLKFIKIYLFLTLFTENEFNHIGINIKLYDCDLFTFIQYFFFFLNDEELIGTINDVCIFVSHYILEQNYLIILLVRKIYKVFI